MIESPSQARQARRTRSSRGRRNGRRAGRRAHGHSHPGRPTGFRKQTRQTRQTRQTQKRVEHEELGRLSLDDVPSAKERTQRAASVSPPPVRDCTHLCLLGLVHGRVLDYQCPNVTQHLRSDETVSSGNHSHRITQDEFLDLVVDEIHRGAESRAEVLHDDLFKMTLEGYGYTFLCKRFDETDRSRLDHELAVYDRLEHIQGKHIPVLLGHVSLQRHVRTECQPKVLRCLLMSFAGNPATAPPGDESEKKRLAAKTEEVLRAFHLKGVLFTPSRPNIFYHESQNIIVTALGTSTIVPEPPPGLSSKAGTPHEDDDSSEDEDYMGLSRLTELYQQGYLNPMLRNIYEARSLF